MARATSATRQRSSRRCELPAAPDHLMRSTPMSSHELLATSSRGLTVSHRERAFPPHSVTGGCRRQRASRRPRPLPTFLPRLACRLPHEAGARRGSSAHAASERTSRPRARLTCSWARTAPRSCMPSSWSVAQHSLRSRPEPEPKPCACHPRDAWDCVSELSVAHRHPLCEARATAWASDALHIPNRDCCSGPSIWLQRPVARRIPLHAASARECNACVRDTHRRSSALLAPPCCQRFRVGRAPTQYSRAAERL